MHTVRTMAGVLALLLLASCSTLPANPTKILWAATVRYYDIQGSTAQELRKDLNAKGPTEGGRGFDAYTKWYFRWSWDGYGSEACDLSTAVVQADIEVIFPRWSASSTASPQLRGSWLRYIDALANHENGHVELNFRHREKILLAIRSASCLTADAAARQTVQSLNALNYDYDQRTRHGRREGATFP